MPMRPDPIARRLGEHRHVLTPPCLCPSAWPAILGWSSGWQIADAFLAAHPGSNVPRSRLLEMVIEHAEWQGLHKGYALKPSAMCLLTPEAGTAAEAAVVAPAAALAEAAAAAQGTRLGAAAWGAPSPTAAAAAAAAGTGLHQMPLLPWQLQLAWMHQNKAAATALGGGQQGCAGMWPPGALL